MHTVYSPVWSIASLSTINVFFWQKYTKETLTKKSRLIFRKIPNGVWVHAHIFGRNFSDFWGQINVWHLLTIKYYNQYEEAFKETLIFSVVNALKTFPKIHPFLWGKTLEQTRNWNLWVPAPLHLTPCVLSTKIAWLSTFDIQWTILVTHHYFQVKSVIITKRVWYRWIGVWLA